jgi:rSAM/selenodomain-associated transferase 1
MLLTHRVLNPESPDSTARGLCALAIMTKAPRAGSVKTRLVPPLTDQEAAALNICFLRDTAAEILAAGCNGRGIGVFTPIGSESAYIDILPADFDLIPQRGENFGERLAFAAEDLSGVGFNSVCLIDSDSPTVPAASYAEAAEVLTKRRADIVLGPSDDGGYYLIGMTENRPLIFENIDWSTERVFAQTVRRANELNLSVHLLPTCYDVDDRQTLRRLCDELLGENPSRSTATETRNFLNAIVRREGRERIWPNE